MTDFKWEEASHSVEMNVRWGKLVRKIPMQQKVVTDRNDLFEYYFLPDGRMKWIYLGSLIPRTATINIEF